MKTISVKDKDFELYISEQEINQIVCQLAKNISEDLKEENPLILAVLNGSFIFVADLVRNLEFDAEISFVKMSSYSGVSSTGTVKQLIGLNESLENRTVLVVEDIIDSGLSMGMLLEELKKYNPKDVKVCTFLFKPNMFKGSYEVHYVGKSISDEFIVGYGLDYDGMGRKYGEIYQLKP